MTHGDAGENTAVSGWNACLALFERRPEAMRRLFVARGKAKLVGHILKWAAVRHLPYKAVDEEELTRVAGTSHHEGLVIVAREARVPDAAALHAQEPSRAGVLILALESVENPHNLGAILRTGAFFGVGAVVMGGAAPPARLSPAVLRTSQGGAECVPVYRTEALPQTLVALQGRGFEIIGTDVFGRDLDPRGPAEGRRVLVLGSERSGMTPAVRAACDRLVRIPGTGAVESLNVSVACGVFLAYYCCAAP